LKLFVVGGIEGVPVQGFAGWTGLATVSVPREIVMVIAKLETAVGLVANVMGLGSGALVSAASVATETPADVLVVLVATDWSRALTVQVYGSTGRSRYPPRLSNPHSRSTPAGRR